MSLLALAHVGVLMRLKRRGDGLERDPTGAVLGDLEDMEVLDWEAVGAKLEAASQGGEDTPDLPDNPGGNTGGEDVDDPNG